MFCKVIFSERLSRPAGNSFSERIAGSAAQIFENLVGREVEVMLLRSFAARKGGRSSVVSN